MSCPDCAAAEARIRALESQRTAFDCRYAGRLAETSGSHCPMGEPCQRCRLGAAEERARRLEEVMRDVQWCQYSINEDGDYEGLCPQCDQTQERGHAPDCRIGMLLSPSPSAAPETKGSE